RAKAQVGPERVEVQRATAIDHYGDFWRERRAQSDDLQRGAELGEERGNVCDLREIMPGESIADQRRPAVMHYSTSSHCLSEAAQGVIAEAADLDTAARGDLDDAISEPSRGCAQFAKNTERKCL